MTKRKSTKRALLMSALSLLLCMSMLIGSTYAWFTDSVTSTGNKIVAGTLDIQLLMDADVDGKYDDISNSTAPIFGADSIAQNDNAETLWEPGKTQVAYLAIKNNGSLDLKYTVGLNVQNVSKDLYKVMKYAIVADANKDAPVNEWKGGNSVVEGAQSVSGDVFLAAGQTHKFALAIHMDETASNEYQGGEVNFDLTVLAAQIASEEDSFNHLYDENADYDGEISTIHALKAAFAKGGTYKVLDDITLGSEALEVPAGKEVALNLNGKTITGETLTAEGGKKNVITNNGTLTFANGSIDAIGINGGSAVYNFGNLTLDNVTVNGASSDIANGTARYAVNTEGAGSTLTLNHVNINGRGAVGATNGTKLVINGGTYHTPEVAWGHAVYAVGAGTEVIINDGVFSEGYAPSGNNWGMYQIYSGNGAVVTVNGGRFMPWDCANGCDLYATNGGQIIVKGGTFAEDPSDQNGVNFVADGYNVTTQYTASGEVLYVVSEKAATNKNPGNVDIAEGAEVTLEDENVQGIVTNNGGTLTVEDTTVHNVADHSYGALLKDGSYTVFTNATITNATGGGITVLNSEAVFESGTVDIQNTASRHMFYVGTDNGFSKLTIKDGTFNLKNKTAKSSYLVAQNPGAVIIVEGGNFEAASTRKAPVQEANGGEVIIKGGTFKWDPTNWVADGYEAVENAGVWTVSAK